MSRLRNRAGIALGASAIAATAIWAAPTVQREAPVACQVITAQEIQKTGQGQSIAEVIQQLPASPTNCPPPLPRQTRLSAFDQTILNAHNVERTSIGVRPLQWDDVLAQHATDYAQVLARTGQLIHAPREGRGDERENVLSAPLGYSPGQMMQVWTREKSNFVPGTFPNIARDGNWNAVLHYSQMIWPTTTYIGCGSAIGGGFIWLDCRYSPGGNKDGKWVGSCPKDSDSAQFIREGMLAREGLQRIRTQGWITVQPHLPSSMSYNWPVPLSVGCNFF